MEGEYLATARNGGVRSLYADLGGKVVEDSAKQTTYQFDLDPEPELPEHFVSVNGRDAREVGK